MAVPGRDEPAVQNRAGPGDGVLCNGKIFLRLGLKA